MKRLPILPTLVVALAAAAMVALGIWQLHRKTWKEGLLAQYAANEHKPPVPFPRAPNDDLLFRATRGTCEAPVAIRMEGAGGMGFRPIATCANDIQVQLGTTHDPQAEVTWQGGTVSGYVSHAPDHRSLIGELFDDTPQQMLLVADTAVGDLAPNPGPDLSAVPNNHLSYAIQWFIFAMLAIGIYLLALRRRNR